MKIPGTIPLNSVRIDLNPPRLTTYLIVDNYVNTESFFRTTLYVIVSVKRTTLMFTKNKISNTENYIRS